MHSHMPLIANALMTTPETEMGDGSIGPNAAPTFVLNPNATLARLVENVRALRNEAPLERRSVVAFVEPSSGAQRQTSLSRERLQAESDVLSNLLSNVR